jgi:hypothetical protein
MENNCKTSPGPGSVKDFFRSSYFWKPFLGIIAGALFGFLYFYFIGCKAGSCAITSDPFMSTITGGLLGFFITSSPCSRCRP